MDTSFETKGGHTSPEAGVREGSYCTHAPWAWADHILSAIKTAQTRLSVLLRQRIIINFPFAALIKYLLYCTPSSCNIYIGVKKKVL
jgi:hypothetical protein